MAPIDRLRQLRQLLSRGPEELGGRLPMASLSAFDGDLDMLDQGWSVVAGELHRRGDLSAKDVETVEILDLYGPLIGSTDKHHGNIALSWQFDQPYGATSSMTAAFRAFKDQVATPHARALQPLAA